MKMLTVNVEDHCEFIEKWVEKQESDGRYFHADDWMSLNEAFLLISQDR